jgi:hypothetical protein
MIVLALVGAISAISTDPKYQLGALYYENDDTYGPRIWKYVFNAEAATAFAAGTVLMNKTATGKVSQAVVCTTSISVHRVMGVAQHAITAQYYGWVLVSGLGLVLADASSYTADTGLIPDASTAGCAADVGGATAAAFALARTSPGGAGTAIAAINCPLAG